jgi:chaperonin GroES
MGSVFYSPNGSTLELAVLILKSNSDRRRNMSATATLKKFKPLSDRVLVKALEKEQEKKGGIIIPDTAKEKPQEGEVISAGPGKRDEQGKLIPMDVKAGDKILYGKYSGTEIKLDDEEYLIMHQDDILGIL